jgi:hypothetical protein
MASSDEVTDPIGNEDRAKLRWAHERLVSMGYEPTDEDDQAHPSSWCKGTGLDHPSRAEAPPAPVLLVPADVSLALPAVAGSPPDVVALADRVPHWS